MASDYYKILGIERDATTEEIKKAFRRIARETHPDANPGDLEAEAEFREAAEAYEVLSDQQRRARYDRGDTIDLSNLFNGIGGLDDLLRSVFGDGGLFGSRAGRPVRGRDVLVRAEITLEEAAFGSEATVEYRSLSTCPDCMGAGSQPGTTATTCPDCGGSGQVRVAQRSMFGTMMSLSTCRLCSGEGSIIDDPCANCEGFGAVQQDSLVNVEIPAGVSTGTRLRLSGRGESGGRRGPPGDLFVEVLVADDPRFERRDSDLVYRASVGIAEATLGSRIEVPLIGGGTVELNVPAGTQPATLLTVSGEGMAVLGRRVRGDLMVVIDLKIPKELTKDEEKALRQWGEIRGERIDRPASTS